MKSPKADAYLAHSDHLPYSLRLGVKRYMAEKAANEAGDLKLTYGQEHEAIACMATARMVEPDIAGKECRPADRVKKWDNLDILHPRATDVVADLADWDPSTSQM